MARGMAMSKPRDERQKDEGSTGDRVESSHFILQAIRTGRMVFVYRAAIVALAAFTAALAGFGLQSLLPVGYLAVSKGMIGSVVSLVASLLSIVLGLSIWTSHGYFTDQYRELQNIGFSVMRLDFELKTYGPDSAPARTLLREQVLHMRARFWSGVTQQGRRSAFNEVLADADAMFAALDMLRPTNGERKEHLATAREKYTTFLQSQITMIRTLTYRVPNFLLIVVLGWSCLLFFGYGLLAGINVLAGVVAALGAAAVASAILVILELRDPYSGLFRMPDWELEMLIKTLSANTQAEGVAR
jgi:hypothetical protein